MRPLTIFVAALALCGSAVAEPVRFVLNGLITSNEGDPFGTSNGFIQMTARYDSDQKFESTGKGGANCFRDDSCPINFGSGEGDDWKLEIGAVTLNASHSELEEFPGFIFNNGYLDNIEELTFVLGTNDSPMNFKPTDGFGCDKLPCYFEGDDGNGGTFEGYFVDVYYEVIGTAPDEREERNTLPPTLRSQPEAPTDLNAN